MSTPGQPVTPPAPGPPHEGLLRRAEGWFTHEEPGLRALASDAASMLQPYATHVGALSLVVKLLAGAAGGGPFAALLPEAVAVAEQAIADIKAALAAPKSG